MKFGYFIDDLNDFDSAEMRLYFGEGGVFGCNLVSSTITDVNT